MTTVSYAQGLVWTPREPPPADAVAAAVSFMLWLYEPRAVSLVSGQGPLPVVASDTPQAAYWTNRPDGGPAVSQWLHFRDCCNGFPSVVPHAMYDAVSSVLFDGADVPSALVAAEKTMHGGAQPTTGMDVVSVNPTAIDGM